MSPRSSPSVSIPAPPVRLTPAAGGRGDRGFVSLGGAHRRSPRRKEATSFTQTTAREPHTLWRRPFLPVSAERCSVGARPVQGCGLGPPTPAPSGVASGAERFCPLSREHPCADGAPRSSHPSKCESRDGGPRGGHTHSCRGRSGRFRELQACDGGRRFPPFSARFRPPCSPSHAGGCLGARQQLPAPSSQVR